MKKVLIIGALLAGGFFLFGQKKDEAGTTEPANDDFLTTYNNRIVVDGDGVWFLVKDGQIGVFQTEANLKMYQANFPQFAQPVMLSESIWKNYAVSNPEIFNHTGF